MMIAYLESFLEALAFLQTQDPRVDAMIVVLYRDSMEKLVKLTTKPG
jgi:hypothetical protein